MGLEKADLRGQWSQIVDPLYTGSAEDSLNNRRADESVTEPSMYMASHL